MERRIIQIFFPKQNSCLHTFSSETSMLMTVTMIQLSWRIFFLELSLENVSLLDCGGTAISMTRRMSRCWASEVDLRGRPHLPRQVTMLRLLRGALDDVLGIRPAPWGNGTLLVCHGGHLVDVLHAPSVRGV